MAWGPNLEEHPEYVLEEIAPGQKVGDQPRDVEVAPLGPRGED